LKQALYLLAMGTVAMVAGCGGKPAPDPLPRQELNAAPAPAAPTDSTVIPTALDAPEPAAANSGDDRIIARINGEAITMRQLLKPLLEAHGLQILIGLVELDLAKQDAREAHVVISPEDIARERDQTLEKMFKDAGMKEQTQLEAAERNGNTGEARQLREQIRKDREQLLVEYLDNQHYSPAEFDLRVQMNAYLRKAAERLLKGKVTDDMVEKEFGVEYGETAIIRIIQCANLQEIGEAQRRLKKGDDFAEVAKELSRDPRTAPLGGEFPQLSRQTLGIPDSFKQLAFSLDPGHVSEPLAVAGNYYLIKMEQKFPPKAVKFENVKDALRRSMYDRLAENLMKQLNGRMGERAAEKLQITDPILLQQFNQYKARQEETIRDRAKLSEQLKKERPDQGATTEPATAPAATEPATAPATSP
jgi:parvulin-like peptidyl-prolyl isomerase